MENNKTKEYYSIDLIHILKTLWDRVWIIVIAGVLSAALGFMVSTFMIAPTYQSSILLYVNNSSFSFGDTSFTMSSSQIIAAQSLVKTYTEILTNRTTLERVIDKTGVPYSYKTLAGMIEAESANETEIMKVTVTAKDPYEAAKIANGIADVLPVRIAEIIDGASMEVVDTAIPNLDKVAPSITMYTFLGMLLGLCASVAVVVVGALLDDTIHDEEYVLQNYNCPILAKVPDLMDSQGKHYGYRYGYRYGYSHSHKENKDKK